MADEPEGVAEEPTGVEMLTMQQICERLSCSPVTVRRLFKRGRIPRYEISKRMHRYDPREVMAALNQFRRTLE